MVFTISTLRSLWLSASPSFVFFDLIFNAPSSSDAIFIWILSSIDEVLVKKRVLLKYLFVYSKLLERHLMVQSLAVARLRLGDELDLLHHWCLMLITLRYSMLLLHKVMLAGDLLIEMMILLLIKDLLLVLRVDLRVIWIKFLIHLLISPWIILRHLRYCVLSILLLTNKIWCLWLTHIKLGSLAIIALTLRRITFFYHWRYSAMMAIRLNRLWKVLLLLI